jgi:hypothetical protein
MANSLRDEMKNGIWGILKKYSEIHIPEIEGWEDEMAPDLADVVFEVIGISPEVQDISAELVRITVVRAIRPYQKIDAYKED